MVTIPGDVDGDFDVDIYDIVEICAACGLDKGDTDTSRIVTWMVTKT